MAPLKFEEELKEKLEGREIKPSINAWDRISQELDAIQKPKRRNFWGYSIAASLIGLLFVSVWVFNSNKNDDVQEIVDTEKKEELRIERKEPVFEASDEVLVNIEEKDKPIIKEEENRSKKEKQHQNNKNIEAKTPAIIADTEIKKELDGKVVKPVFEDKFMEKQLNNVLKSVAQLEANNTNISDAEVDSLLRQAQREILKEKALEAGISVDAMALLYEVEDELDETFRDKVLEKLKDGFQKVKTAVADRNN